MSAKHTPGPWVATGIGGPWEQRLSIRAPGWGCVAHVGVNPSLPHWDLPQRSNARLIAAAPELLEACVAMIEWDDRERDHAVSFEERCALCEQAFTKARAAIAKATEAVP